MISVAGCASVPEPHIESYTKEVDAQLSRADALLADEEADRIARESQYAAMAEAGAYFSLPEEGCAPMTPLVAGADGREKVLVAERCVVTASAINAETGRPDAFDLDGTDANRIANGRAAIAGLRDYTAALDAILSSEAYGDVVANFDAAAAAITGAAVAASRLDGGEGLSDARLAVAESGRSLASGIVGGAVERIRAQAIRDLVTENDDRVHGVTQAVAALMHRFEKAALLDATDAFELAADEQLAIALRDADAGERAAKLASFMDAKEALEELDADRRSLAVLRIGKAHRAIAQSYRKAGDIDAFLAAQREILDLIEAGEALEDDLKAI